VTEGEINLTNDKIADISTDLGAITAGSLNINSLFTVSSAGVVVIKSAASGSRVEINANKILVYDGSDLRVKLGYLGT